MSGGGGMCGATGAGGAYSLAPYMSSTAAELTGSPQQLWTSQGELYKKKIRKWILH